MGLMSAPQTPSAGMGQVEVSQGLEQPDEGNRERGLSSLITTGSEGLSGERPTGSGLWKWVTKGQKAPEMGAPCPHPGRHVLRATILPFQPLLSHLSFLQPAPEGSRLFSSVQIPGPGARGDALGGHRRTEAAALSRAGGTPGIQPPPAQGGVLGKWPCELMSSRSLQTFWPRGPGGSHLTAMASL